MDNFNEAVTNVIPNPGTSLPVDPVNIDFVSPEVNNEPDVKETPNIFEPGDTANEPVFDELGYDYETEDQLESSGEQTEVSEVENNTELAENEAEQQATDSSVDDVYYEKLEEVRNLIEEQIELNKGQVEQQNMTNEQVAAAMLMLAILLEEDRQRRGDVDKSMIEVIFTALGNLMKEMFVPEDESEGNNDKKDSKPAVSVDTSLIKNMRQVFAKRQSQMHNLA